jgi:hypothetical protein
LNITDINDVDEKRFWMNLINPGKNEMGVIERIKYNLKTVNSILAVLSIIMIILSQIEYEVLYYPNFYVNKTPDNYTGLSVRIIYTVITFIISK